jgi:hypothetical protein
MHLYRVRELHGCRRSGQGAGQIRRELSAPGRREAHLRPGQLLPPEPEHGSGELSADPGPSRSRPIATARSVGPGNMAPPQSDRPCVPPSKGVGDVILDRATGAEAGMDPITLIVAALAAGAALGIKDTASSAVQDAYASLKAHAKKRLAGRPDAEMVGRRVCRSAITTPNTTSSMPPSRLTTCPRDWGRGMLA